MERETNTKVFFKKLKVTLKMNVRMKEKQSMLFGILRQLLAQ